MHAHIHRAHIFIDFIHIVWLIHVRCFAALAVSVLAIGEFDLIKLWNKSLHYHRTVCDMYLFILYTGRSGAYFQWLRVENRILIEKWATMEMGDFQFLILYHNLINFQYKYLIFLLFMDIYVACWKIWIWLKQTTESICLAILPWARRKLTKVTLYHPQFVFSQIIDIHFNYLNIIWNYFVKLSRNLC